jgi:hypothetical protein
MLLFLQKTISTNLKMLGGKMFKKLLNGFIEQPLFASIYLADFFILLFHRPPFLFSVLMVGGLVAMSMYMGQKLSLFNK